jgi:pyrimidine-nucleoside phosphorylase
MENLDEARELSRLMIGIGKLAGRRVVTLLSDMNQPLGEAVGNALEIIEAIVTLHGGGPADFRKHCLRVSAHMLKLGGLVSTLTAGHRMAEAVIASGAAFEKLRVLVNAQGGELAFVDDPKKFPKAKFIELVKADRSGYLRMVNARLIGEAAVRLGAGRAKKGDSVDHTVGFIIHRKVGDYVELNQPLFTVFANDKVRLLEAIDSVRKAYAWSKELVLPLPLFYH